jgi:hypothetical protein
VCCSFDSVHSYHAILRAWLQIIVLWVYKITVLMKNWCTSALSSPGHCAPWDWDIYVSSFGGLVLFYRSGFRSLLLTAVAAKAILPVAENSFNTVLISDTLK